MAQHETIGAKLIYETALTKLYLTDAVEWLENTAAESIHGVVTDPPYGFVEYQQDHLDKLERGRGGVWRIPPTLDGITRSPVPRFTVLSDAEKRQMQEFFDRWARALYRTLVPGAHVFIATTPLLSYIPYTSLMAAGFEVRGQFIRLVTTLRGGDRPKNAEEEFADVSVMPRSNHEPWGIFRKPCEGRVADNLRKWGTGGLRRTQSDDQFGDVLVSPRTPKQEKQIAAHPTLKPQHLLRHLVWSVLPLGEGVVLDPFSGSGSTLAAAEAVGYHSVGLELNPRFGQIAIEAIPQLAQVAVNGETRNGRRIQDQLALID